MYFVLAVYNIVYEAHDCDAFYHKTIILIVFLIFCRKKAKAMREKAKKDSEKTLKSYNKRQTKAEVMADKEMRKLNKEWDNSYTTTNNLEDYKPMPHRPSTVLTALKKITRSTSQGMFDMLYFSSSDYYLMSRRHLS